MGRSSPSPAVGTRRILLWSPEGAGNRYPAPAMATYRMYASGSGDGTEVHLAHGVSAPAATPLFRQQHFVAPYGRGMAAQVRFLMGARGWVGRNADGFDLFHGVTSYHACSLPAYWAESRHLPAILRVASHQGDLADKKGWRRVFGLPRKRRELVQRLSGLVAISSDIALELLSYGIDEKNIALIPNGVDVDRFHPLTDPSARSRVRGELGWPDIPTILYVGRVNRSKQPHYVLRAAERLRDRGYDLHVAFVGPVDDAAYFGELTNQVDAAGLGNRVTWKGFTEEIARPYQAADVFVLPSVREGMPNVLLEAMASGVPAVSTRVSGATDAIVDGQSGALIDDDPDALYRALLAYLNDEGLRVEHGAAARRRAVEVFSISAVYAAHQRLFRSILGSGGSASDASLMTLHG